MCMIVMRGIYEWQGENGGVGRGGCNDMGWYNGVRREMEGESGCMCIGKRKYSVGMNGSVWGQREGKR